METSDSEYFESADEDFESDYEENKQSVRKNFTPKTTETGICNPKVDSHETRGHKAAKSMVGTVNDTVDKAQDNELENSDVRSQSISPKEKSKDSELLNSDSKIESENSAVRSRSISLKEESEETELLNSVCELGKPEETHTQSLVSKNICEDVTTTNKKLINETNLINYSEKLSDCRNSSMNEVPTTRLMKTMSDSQSIEECKDVKPNKVDDTSQLDSKSDESNLWDDDEIDWGSEAAKEEPKEGPQITKELSSKNDDSGWDDFDAEWESEIPISNQVTGTVDNSKSTKEKNVKNIEPSTMPSIESAVKENLWNEDEDWEPLEKPKQNETSWSGWGDWGVSSILNTATQSVSSFSTHVSQGLSTVLESSMGIPDPEEMARISKIQREKEKELSDQETLQNQESHLNTPAAFGLGNLVSGVSQLTKFVESTGTKVIAGGLDTLEAIGKKTVEVLQEGDPGLKKKRAFLKLDTGKPNLSQILREAKQKSEEEVQEYAHTHIGAKRLKNYEALFDDHHGLVHLEALEMISKLCSIKLDNLKNSLSGEALKEMQETLDQVKELCELPEDEEEDKISLEEAKEAINNAVREIGIPISYGNMLAVCEETDSWLENINFSFVDDVDLHQQAIETLAQLTALAVEQFHKAGELLMVKDHRSTADEADSLVQITTTVKSLILSRAEKFTHKLSAMEKSDNKKISEHITNIFYEAANSGTYIQDAFQLLTSVLQVGAV